MFNPSGKKKPQKFEEELSPEVDQFLAEACAEYDAKQELLLRGEWRLESCSEWGMDDATAVITIHLEDGTQWQADAQFLGSYTVDDQSFQWAWDNPNVSENLTRDSQIVKEIHSHPPVWMER